uniref:NB-ARC domain-containing protein n=1 Tax=Chenopodium quinoa TaxID=63459 RepID=A0A803N3A0_CHEQI
MVLYQVDDLFDLVLTVDRQKQQIEVNKQVCVSFSRSGTLCFNWKISREIKSIRQQLCEINSDIAGLNLPAYGHRDEPQPLRARFMRNRETCSFVKAEDVIGRETDKNIIIGMLFNSNNDGKRIAVIPIVGLGGIGKTTLAQLVFNDEGVQNHFDLTKWVCVPELGDQNTVIRRVYQCFTGDKDFDRLLFEDIVSSIQVSIKDKKYLLVLDDIWDESRDSWLDLLSLLECGANGSRVIVTTRSANVAKAVGTAEPHSLGLLAEEESWNLFKKIAFRLGQEESNPGLTQLGKEIVESCGNVPLAIRVVGSLLHSENSEKHWQRIRNARLSKAKRNEDNSIMQVLKLSCDYLPSALKQCFAYCSLFKKNYTYRKDKLVKLWMAQGYFDPSSTDTGEQYFLELLGRNLFQDPNEDDVGNVICCKMHDLVHDLAQDIAGEEMKQVEPSDKISSTDGLMHVSFKKRGIYSGWKVSVSLLAARKMRSVTLSSNYFGWTIETPSLKMAILKFQSLRVLDLEGMNISVVPNSVGKLRHLRYLSLESNYSIRCLPNDITRLQNLQTLKLRYCVSLTELPRDFFKLDDLRHLEIAGSGLSDFPVGFGKMTSLKELDVFVVGKSCGIDSLPPLNFCENQLITFCKWRSDAVVEAQRANLKDNQRLISLCLDFKCMEVAPNLSEMDKMLMFLQLPPNLKDIGVHYYEGVEMPRRWLDGLSKLVSIRIEDCSNCRVLPHLSRLPYLNEICLSWLDDLEYVEDEGDIWVSGGGECGSGSQNGYFPSLTTLSIDYLSSIKGWTRPAKDDDGDVNIEWNKWNQTERRKLLPDFARK